MNWLLICHHCHMNLVWTSISFNLPGHMTMTILMKFILWQHAELLTVLAFITCALGNPKNACAAVDEYIRSKTLTRKRSIFLCCADWIPCKYYWGFFFCLFLIMLLWVKEVTVVIIVLFLIRYLMCFFLVNYLILTTVVMFTVRSAIIMKMYENVMSNGVLHSVPYQRKHDWYLRCNHPVFPNTHNGDIFFF